MEIMQCPHCKKPFGYSEIGGQMPGTKESEEITCPNCHKVAAKRHSNGVFRSSKLSDAQIAKWQAEKSK